MLVNELRFRQSHEQTCSLREEELCKSDRRSRVGKRIRCRFTLTICNYYGIFLRGPRIAAMRLFCTAICNWALYLIRSKTDTYMLHMHGNTSTCTEAFLVIDSAPPRFDSNGRLEIWTTLHMASKRGRNGCVAFGA